MYRKDSRTTPRLSILHSALASALTLTVMNPLAHAQQAATPAAQVSVHFYDLKPASLVETLNAIAAISGRRIEFDREDLRGGRANAVNGNYSAGAAISQALNGTRYLLNEDQVGTLVVTAAPTVTVVARRDQAETEFKADRSDTATRSGTSLHLVPGSVTLITGKVLESQQATNLVDALRNVSGMKFNQSPQRTTTFGIRGFNASSNTNGVSDVSATSRSIFSVERVEVLKGPQAILSGGDALGGAVNIVVKKPQAETIQDLTLQYGSFGDKTAAVDFSGALSEDKRLTYRTVASVQDVDDSENDMSGKNGKGLTQSFRWKDAKTDFIVSGDYSRERNSVPRYTFARRDGVILPEPDRLLGNRYDGFDATVRRLGYQLEHAFAKNVVLISRLQKSEEEFDLHVSTPGGLEYATGAAPNSPLPNMDFYASRTINTSETLSGDHYLRLNLATWELRHKLSAGFNHTNYSLRGFQRTGDAVEVPVYSSTPYLFQDLRDRATKPAQSNYYGSRQRAVYLQDLITYEKWNFLLNWRRNRYTDTASESVFFGTPDFVFASEATTMYHTSPGAGIVYQLNDKTSLYASYGEGFIPFTGLSCDRGAVPPNITRNRELGAKFDLLDSRFTLTTSLFSLQQSNTLVYDRINQCYNSRDAQRTRGAEIDAQGRLLPGLETIFNYTYTRVEDPVMTTLLFPGEPKHKMNAWAVYRLQSPDWKGFGFGMGVTANSSSLGSTNPARQFIIPGGAQVDASLYYAQGPWNVTFGVKNLLDRTLYGTTVSSDYVPLLPGRTFALTVKRSFK